MILVYGIETSIMSLRHNDCGQIDLLWLQAQVLANSIVYSVNRVHFISLNLGIVPTGDAVSIENDVVWKAPRTVMYCCPSL